MTAAGAHGAAGALAAPQHPHQLPPRRGVGRACLAPLPCSRQACAAAAALRAEPSGAAAVAKAGQCPNQLPPSQPPDGASRPRPRRALAAAAASRVGPSAAAAAVRVQQHPHQLPAVQSLSWASLPPPRCALAPAADAAAFAAVAAAAGADAGRALPPSRSLTAQPAQRWTFPETLAAAWQQLACYQTGCLTQRQVASGPPKRSTLSGQAGGPTSLKWPPNASATLALVARPTCCPYPKTTV